MKTSFVFLFVALFSGQAMALSCHGTEPFWGAEISPEKVIFIDPILESEKTIDLVSKEAPAGFSDSFMQIYTNANGPVAVVTSNKCSDGMSDFVYPNELILFTDNGTLYGCCGEGVATGPGI